MSVLPCVLRLCGARGASCQRTTRSTERMRTLEGGWREFTNQIKMSDEPSDVSEVANNTSDVPEQVPGKKQDAARNKRDASVLEKLKTSSVEDIILDETKTQILSIAGVEYSSLSAKVRLQFC